MKPIEGLNYLKEKCKGGVIITMNPQRSNYESCAEYFADQPQYGEINGIDSDVFEKMLKENVMVEIQFYPETPIGFNKVYHYDISGAIEEAVKSYNYNCK